MRPQPYSSFHDNPDDPGWTETPATNSVVQMARYREDEVESFIARPDDDDCCDLNCFNTPACMVRMRFGLMLWSLFVGCGLIVWASYHGADPDIESEYHFLANWNVITMLVIGIITVLTTPAFIFASAFRHRGLLFMTASTLMLVVFYLIILAVFLFVPDYQRKIADLDKSSPSTCCNFPQIGRGCPVPNWGDGAAAIFQSLSQGARGGKRLSESSNYCQVSVFFLDYGVYDHFSVGVNPAISPPQASAFAITASGKPMFAPYLLIAAALLEFVFVMITVFTRAKRSQIPPRYSRPNSPARMPGPQSPYTTLRDTPGTRRGPPAFIPGPPKSIQRSPPAAMGTTKMAAREGAADMTSPFVRSSSPKRQFPPPSASNKTPTSLAPPNLYGSRGGEREREADRGPKYSSASVAPTKYASAGGGGNKYASAGGPKYTSVPMAPEVGGGVMVHVGQLGVSIREVRGGDVEVSDVRSDALGGSRDGGSRKMRRGDVIRRIDGDEVGGRGVHWVAARLRGTPGTWVTVGFRRFDSEHLQYEHLQRSGELGVFPTRLDASGGTPRLPDRDLHTSQRRAGSPTRNTVEFDPHASAGSPKAPAFLSAPQRPPELYPTEFARPSPRDPPHLSRETPYKDSYTPREGFSVRTPRLNASSYTPRGTGSNPRGVPSRELRELASPKDYYESEARPRYSTPSRLTRTRDASPEEERLYGVGIYMQPDELGGLRVASLIPGGPAEHSGQVSPGDEIVSIDATPVHGLPLSVLSAALLGPRGSVLLLGLRRPGSPSSTNVALIRGAAAASSPGVLRSHRNASPSAPIPLQASPRRDYDGNLSVGGGGGGGLSGVGLEFAFRGDGAPVVTRLEPGGPADACRRIDVNDILVEIDGVRVFGMSRTFIACLLTGTPASPVAITLTKADTGRVVHVALNRTASVSA